MSLSAVPGKRYRGSKDEENMETSMHEERAREFEMVVYCMWNGTKLVNLRLDAAEFGSLVC